MKYWIVSGGIIRTPLQERSSVLSTVAVEPQISRLLASAKNFDKKHWDNYGTPIHRLYWGPSVDGEDDAILGDCMDLTHFGRRDALTGNPLTVGIPRSNIRGTFHRTSDGSWRVSGLQVLGTTPC